MAVRRFAADDITGTWVPILTPFDADDRLDLDVLRSEIGLVLDARPNGVFTHGTAGEFFNQTEDEWGLVATTVADACHEAEMPFQLGASHPSPVVALDRIRRARQLEPAAIQVLLPDWLVLNREEVLRCLEGYSRAADGIGLVLYNPPHAKNVLDPEGLAALCAACEGIVGIKTVDGPAQWYRAMAPVLRRVSVFVPGHHLATGLSHGARGSYSNVSCLSPGGAVHWAGQAESDPVWALGVEEQIASFMAEAVVPLQRRGYTSATLDKALAAAGGWFGPVGRVRWPHATARPDEIDHIRAVARAMLPEFLHPAASTGGS